MAPKKPGKRKPIRASKSSEYASPSWKRVYLLSKELKSLAKSLGLNDRDRDPDGFDLLDASHELARLAENNNRKTNPAGRKPAQEREDWVAVAGVGADLGNMAEEGTLDRIDFFVRAIGYEACYLACNFLF